MKKFILPLAAAVSLVACSQSPEDKVVEYAKSVMKDPKSFELVQVKPSDTIRLSHYISSTELAPLNAELDIVISKIKTSLDYAGIYVGSYYSSWKYKKYMDEADEYKVIGDSLVAQSKIVRERIESLMDTPQDTVVSYRWYLSCYGNNSMGEKVLNEMIVDVPVNGDKITHTTGSSEYLKQLKHNVDVATAKFSVR